MNILEKALADLESEDWKGEVYTQYTVSFERHDQIFGKELWANDGAKDIRNDLAKSPYAIDKSQAKTIAGRHGRVWRITTIRERIQ